MLPLGSVLYLIDGNQKLIIVGRGMLVEQKGKKVVFDYAGVAYPQGLNPDEIYYFNDEDVDEIVFEGYKNDEENRYVQLYLEWLSDRGAQIPKGVTE